MGDDADHVVVKYEYIEPETSHRTKKRKVYTEVELDSSDSESVHSEVKYPSNNQPRQVVRKPGGARATEHVSIARETEDELADWLHQNPLFYDKCDPDFKDAVKKNQLMEDKAAEYGLTGANLQLWYRNMRTVYSRQVKPGGKNSAGNPGVRLTARQQWTVKKFDFLKDFIAARTTPRASRKVASPIEEFESDAGSVSESPITNGLQAVSSQPLFLTDVNGKWTASRDQLSVSMANAISNDSTLEAINQHESGNSNDRAQQGVSSNIRQLFGAYLNAEMELLTEDQFYSFQAESMAMLSTFRQARQNRRHNISF